MQPQEGDKLRWTDVLRHCSLCERESVMHVGLHVHVHPHQHKYSISAPCALRIRLTIRTAQSAKILTTMTSTRLFDLIMFHAHMCLVVAVSKSGATAAWTTLTNAPLVVKA
jgi:hypothetical protein